jgi:hypothetical protein
LDCAAGHTKAGLPLHHLKQRLEELIRVLAVAGLVDTNPSLHSVTKAEVRASHLLASGRA